MIDILVISLCFILPTCILMGTIWLMNKVMSRKGK